MEEEIKKLKTQLQEKEQNLLLAAHYGKTLLEENSELHSKLDQQIKDFGKQKEVRLDWINSWMFLSEILLIRNMNKIFTIKLCKYLQKKRLF